MEKIVKSSATGWVIKVKDKGITMTYYYRDPLHENEVHINYMVENNCFNIARSYEWQGITYHVLTLTKGSPAPLLKDLLTCFKRRDILMYYRRMVINGYLSNRAAARKMKDDIVEFGLDRLHLYILSENMWPDIHELL